MTELLIWDSDQGIPEKQNRRLVIFWNGYDHTDFDEFGSILVLVEKNAEKYRSEYLKLIHDTGIAVKERETKHPTFVLRMGLSAWCFSRASQNCNFSKSNQINDIIKIFALLDFIETTTKITSIKVVTSNKCLREVLSEWCQKNSFQFTFKLEKRANPVNQTLLRRLYFGSPKIFQGIFRFLSLVIQNWRLKGVGIKEWKCNTNLVTFFSYSRGLSATDEVLSPYWGRLPNRLQDKKISINWLHIYTKDKLLPKSDDAAKQAKDLNSKSGNKSTHVFPESFLSFPVLFQIFSDWIKFWLTAGSYSPKVGSLSRHGLNLEPFFVEDWKESFFGEEAVSNLWLLNLIEEAVKHLPPQNVGFFLYENQPWELALINSWNQSRHGEIIGVAHTAVRFWDLRYFSYQPQKPKNCVNQAECPFSHKPDKVALNGELAKLECLKGGYDPEDILEVEAVRYNVDTLDKNHNPKSHNPSERSRSGHIDVLVYGEYELASTNHMLRLIAEVMPFLPSDYVFYFKPHPLSANTRALIPPGVTFRYEEDSNLISDQFDLVITGSLSAASLDAYQLGISLIVILDQKSLNLCPLRGQDGVRFVGKSTDLLEALKACSNPPLGHGASIFYRDHNLDRWLSLITEKSVRKKKASEPSSVTKS